MKATPALTEQTDGHVSGEWKAEDDELSVSCLSRVEFDGWMNYTYTIEPKKICV